MKDFPDAIKSIYPQTHLQLCIIHMVHNSLKYVSWKDDKAVTCGQKAIYQAPTEDAALMALGAFAEEWDNKYPQISKSWRAHREISICSLAIPDIRRPTYTANAIESLNSVISAGAKALHMAAAAAELAPDVFGFANGGMRYGGVANAAGIGISIAADAAAITGGPGT